MLGQSQHNALVSRWVDRCLVVCLALASYLALARAECEGDGAQYLYNYLLGYTEGGRHYLIYVALSWADGAAGLLGISLYQAAVGMSAVGAALGLGFVHAAWQHLGCGRAAGVLNTALVAVCPGVVLYATVYELHGVFFTFAGAGFWALARYVAQPTRAAAVLLGVCSGLSYLAHATGALMVVAYAALGAAATADRRGGGWRELRTELPRALVVGLSGMFAIAGSIGLLGWGGSETNLSSAWAFLVEWSVGNADGIVRPPVALWGTLWWEWLLPFLPASVLWLALLRRRNARWLAFAFGASVLGYLVFCAAMLRGIVEWGAYVLPLAAPAVWLARRALPHGAVAVLMLVGGAGAFFLGIPAARSDDVAKLGAALAELADNRTIFLLGNSNDLEPFVIHAPGAVWFTLQVVTHSEDAEAVREATRGLVSGAEDRVRAGARVLLTPGAWRVLYGAASPRNPGASIAREVIEERFVVEPFHERPPFSGYRLVLR